MLQISSPYDIIAASTILDALVVGMMLVFCFSTLYPCFSKMRFDSSRTKMMFLDAGVIILVTIIGWFIMILIQSFLLWIGSGYFALVGQDLESFSNIINSTFDANLLTIPLCLILGSVLGVIWGDRLMREKEDGMSKLGIFFSTLAVSFFISIMTVLFLQNIGLFVVVV
jgi:hypothetical protein